MFLLNIFIHLRYLFCLFTLLQDILVSAVVFKVALNIDMQLFVFSSFWVNTKNKTAGLHGKSMLVCRTLSNCLPKCLSSCFPHSSEFLLFLILVSIGWCLCCVFLSLYLSTKGKKPIRKGCVPCDFNYMTCWKRRSYGDSEKISSCWESWEKEGRIHEADHRGFLVTLLCWTLMVETWNHTFVWSMNSQLQEWTSMFCGTPVVWGVHSKWNLTCIGRSTLCYVLLGTLNCCKM